MFDSLGHVGAGELGASRYLPYIDHCADGRILCEHDAVVATIRAPGAPYALTHRRERNAHVRRHVAWLNAIADDNVEVFEHLVKHNDPPPLGQRPLDVSPYAQQFLGDYYGEMDTRLRCLEWYVTIVIKPRSWLFGLPPHYPVVRLFAPKAQLSEHEVQLEQAVLLFNRLMAHTFPTRLGVREEDGLLNSEIMEAFYRIRTMRSMPQPLIDGGSDLGQASLTDDVICGPSGFEVRHAPNGSDSSFGAMLALSAYPRHRLNAAKADKLLALDGCFALTNAIRFQTRAQQQDQMELLRRQIMTSTSSSRSAPEEDDIVNAINAVSAGREERAITRWSLALHADIDGGPKDNLREVDRLVGEVKDIFADAGAKVTTENYYGCALSFWGQFPYAPEKCWIRQARLDTGQYAKLSTLNGEPRGSKNPRWGGHAIRFETLSGTAYDWELFVNGVGHTAVLAPNGAGKTVLVGEVITAAHALIAPFGGTILLLDVDESNHNVIAANGGVYSTIRVNEASGVVPLLLKDTPRMRHMLRELIAGLCMWNGGAAPDPQERRGIVEGINYIMDCVPPNRRHLGIIRRFMGPSDGGAGDRLEAWCREFSGEMAWAFDGTRHVIDLDQPLVGIDITQILSDQHVMPPMTTVLMWMASEAMDGRRFLFIQEEAPAYGNDPRFDRLNKAIALRARKRNVAFVPIAQMAEHLLETAGGKALLKQARQFILLPNDKADRDVHCDDLGFSDHVYEWVREKLAALPFHAAIIVRLDGESVVVRNDLSPFPNHLAVFSGTPKSVALMRDCQKTHGPDPASFLPAFWRRLSEVTV